MAGKRSDLQRAIDQMLNERNQLDGFIRKLEHLRDDKPTRKPRKAKAEKAVQS